VIITDTPDVGVTLPAHVLTPAKGPMVGLFGSVILNRS